MTMRLLNRLLALLCGIAFVATAVLIVTEIVRSRIGTRPWLVSWLRVSEVVSSRSWTDNATITVCAVIGGAGLVLLLLQVLPRRRPSVRLDKGAAGVRPLLSKRSLRRVVETLATAEPGVIGSSVGVGNRKITVRVTTSLGESGDPGLVDRIERRVTEHVKDIRLARAPRVRVSVTPGGGR